jgi:TRAP-type C4-dicarboxylate transport system permease small subunit
MGLSEEDQEMRQQGRTARYVALMATAGQYSAAAALMLMTLHIALAGVLRAFTHPVEGAADLTGTYYMVTIIALPLARVHLTSGLLKAEALESYMSPPVRDLMSQAGRWLSVQVCGYVCVASIALAHDLTAHLAAVELSESQFAAWPAGWIPPLGLGLLTIALIGGAAPHVHGEEHGS